MRVRLKARAPSGGNIARRAGMALGEENTGRVSEALLKLYATAWRHLEPSLYRLTLSLTNQACFGRRNPLLWVLLPITLVNLCRIEDSHGAAATALIALAAPPPVLTNSAAAAVLAPAAIPPVLADANAAAVLAPVALAPMLADTAAAAVLAPVALPPVLAHPLPHSTFAQPVGRRLTSLGEVLQRDTRS